MRTAALLLILAATPFPASSQIILSEALADPSALPDAQGEFLELANAGTRREAADSAFLAVDGDTLALGPVDLAPGAHLLLCRDSAALAAAGVACHRAQPGLSLANSRPLAVAVLWNGMRSAFTIPAAKPGVSWENTLDDGAGLLAFARCSRTFLAGDSATPGFRNSRSVRPAARDLGLSAALMGGDGSRLEVTVWDRGAERAGGLLRVGVDGDWDGTAETPVGDAVEVRPGGGGLSLALDPDHLGLLRLELAGDEDPAGNSLSLLREAGRTLEISEACPAPEAGPEWAEIRNATGEGGGFPRALDLSRVEWNGRALGPAAGRLGPGEYLLVTEDAAGLRARLGPLKVRIAGVAGWGSLRNTGDTLRLSLAGHPLDSLAYAGSEAAKETGCVVRARSGDGGASSSAAAAAATAAPTPGYPSPVATAPRFALDLSSRVLAPGGRLDIVVETPPGSAWALRIFDLEGNLRGVLARGAPGRHEVAWSGGGLPPGPYLLGLASGSRRPLRVPVILAGPR